VNKAASPIRVLLVEDSPGQRALLVGLLNASDSFTVVGVAGNGRQAVQETLRLRPDVIAMDIHLPLMDGYEATREIMQRCPTFIPRLWPGFWWATSPTGTAGPFPLRGP
jgi:two-component system chemotaxis response regulator CheB